MAASGDDCIEVGAQPNIEPLADCCIEVAAQPSQEDLTELSTLPSELLLQIALLAAVADVGRLAMASRRFGLPDVAAGSTVSVSEEALYVRARASFQALAKVMEPSWGQKTMDHKWAQDVDAYRRGILWASLGPMALRLDMCSRSSGGASAPSPLRIFIQVIVEDGRKVIFQCRLSTKLGKLFAAFCHNEGFERCGEAELARGDVLFYYHGLLLKWDDTPAALNMQIGTMDDAVIIDALFRAHRKPEPQQIPGLIRKQLGKQAIVYSDETRILRRGMSGLRL